MIKILNAYKIPLPTKKELGQAAKYYGYDHLITKTGTYKEKYGTYNFQDLGYLEVLADKSFNVRNVNYENTQVPYLEIYLDEHKDEVIYNPNGSLETRIGDKEDLPERFRVLFFIHFLKEDTKILYNTDKHYILDIHELPDNLKKYAQYIPVD